MGKESLIRMSLNKFFYKLDKKEIEVKRIFLFLTKKCNLKCEYCFVKNEDVDISFEFFKKIIDIFVESKGDNKLLYYYGGEPLLKIELLEKLETYYAEKLKSAKKNGESIVVTNGTLMSKRIFDFFKKSNVKLMVSLGGKKERHDMYRTYLSGNSSSFDKVLENLKMFKKAIGMERIWVSYTFTKSMAPFLFEDLNYLYSLGFRNLHLEPVQFYEKWTEEDIACFVKGYRSFLSFILDRIDSGDMVFVSKVLRILEQSEKKEITGERYDYYTHLRFWPKENVDFFHFKIDGVDNKILYSGNKMWEAYNDLNIQFIEILSKYRKRNALSEYLIEGMNRII